MPLRVLIVDDSRIYRSVIAEALAEIRDLKVVGSVWSGEKALESARESLPDFVTLDVEMPGMGGLDTLRALKCLAKEQHQPLGIVLVSSHTQRGAAVTVEGLAEGAFDYIAKPADPDPAANLNTLRRELSAKIEAYRSRRRIESPTPLPALRSSGPAPAAFPKATKYRALLIAASTGGPEALTRLLPTLAGCPIPIMLVQHLPLGFSEYFQATLSQRCGLPVQEARSDDEPQPGVVYLAPGGRHLMVINDGRIRLGLSDSPPECGCRPAADVLFRSAAAAYSGQVLAVVLTGMGRDGTAGAKVLRRAGGHVLVQDEESSTVWGMPGSIVEAGLADEIHPLKSLGSAILNRLQRRN